MILKETIEKLKQRINEHTARLNKEAGSPYELTVSIGYAKTDKSISFTELVVTADEKLYEEKLMAEEGLKKTVSDLIYIGCPIPFDVDLFLSQLNELMMAAYSNQKDIRKLVAKMVSTYYPTDEKVGIVDDNEPPMEEVENEKCQQANDE